MTRRKGIIRTATAEAILVITILLLFFEGVIGTRVFLALCVCVALTTSAIFFLIIRNTPPEE